MVVTTMKVVAMRVMGRLSYGLVRPDRPAAVGGQQIPLVVRLVTITNGLLI